MAKRIARRALSIGLSDVVAKGTKARDRLTAVEGVVDWVKKALSIAGICDHKEWVLGVANKAIDQVVATLKLPAWLKTILADAAKAQVKAMIDKACPV